MSAAQPSALYQRTGITDNSCRIHHLGFQPSPCANEMAMKGQGHTMAQPQYSPFQPQPEPEHPPINSQTQPSPYFSPQTQLAQQSVPQSAPQTSAANRARAIPAAAITAKSAKSTQAFQHSKLAFTLLDKLDSLSRRAIFQSFQTLLRSKKREKVRRFFLNLTFSRRKSGRRGPLMIANMQNSN